jgi:heat shock protein HslJ
MPVMDGLEATRRIKETAAGKKTPVVALTAHAFEEERQQIMEAGCVNVAWSVDMASLVQIKRDGAIVLDNAPHDGAGQDCLQESGTVVYEVFASNPTGQFVSEQRSVQVEPAPPGPEFTDKTWELTRYYDGVGAMLSVLDGTEVTALFDTEGNLQGSAGCNTYQAKYQTNGNQMTISEIVLTQVLCSDPAGIMEQEDKFIENLEKTTIFQFSDRDLELFDDSQPDQEPQPLLEFIDQEQSR